jgi:diacylglycerol kinase family enzyme
VTEPAPRRRVRLIVNPAASAVSTRLRAAVNRALADHELDEVETREPNHATELAREAAAEGIEAVVVLGGDGTVNEVANGLLASGTETALAPLPAGSTNVFARTMGLPRHADDAAARIAGALAAGSSRMIPVGWANGRAFLFHVGVGFDAAVVEQVERRSTLKRKVGQAIFVYAAFATWFRHFDHSRPRFQVDLQDGSTVDDGYFGICLNTNPYTYLGPRPLNVAPGATGERGLTMVTLRKLKVGALLGVTGRALGKGDRVGRHRDIDMRRNQPRLVVRGHGPVPWQMDGDYMGEVDELVLTSERDRLRVVLPVANDAGAGPDV